MLNELCAAAMAPGYSGCVKMAATSYRQYDVTMDSDHFTSMWYIQCMCHFDQFDTSRARVLVSKIGGTRSPVLSRSSM